MTAAPCGCPTGPGRSITDEARHADWHRLVIEQGGPAGLVNAETLRAARGWKTPPPPPSTPTAVDDAAILSGKRRSSQADVLEARARANARKAAADGRTRDTEPIEDRRAGS